MAAAQPTGTVTMLFTDIEGSTRLLELLGRGRYAQALDQHRRLLRAAFERNGGYEVDYEGDTFIVAFSRAEDAVAAAEKGQRALAAAVWPDDTMLRVRMGLHTGEPLVVPPKYVGLDVHKAARIMAAGHGGQVILSAATHDLIGPSVALRDCGLHRLKDLTEPQHLYELLVDGLDRNHPPLRTLENRPTNLPMQPTPLIGRQRELGEAADLLRRRDARLVTFTGPGGTGKTRLALQVAAETIDDHPGGVFFVTLGALTDPALVVTTIAQTVGIREQAHEAVSETLARELGDKRMLLVLDNFEHLEAAAPALADLLRATTSLQIIVTSRWPLHLSGEREYPISSLPVPEATRPLNLDALAQFDAVTLFIERAQAVKPDFQVTNANAAAVAEICVRLDGLPLAIELAAARIRILPAEALLARLDQRLKLLTGGARDVPARHQTLRGTLAWSYDLLGQRERRLFARLSIFGGGCTLEAAEAVCGPPELEGEFLDAIESLVEKNLLRQRLDPDNEPRFWMLQTIREYAVERLAESADFIPMQSSHASYYCRLADGLNGRWFDRDRERLQAELELDLVNLRSAQTYALAAGDIETAATIALSASRLTYARGSVQESGTVARVVLESAGCPAPLIAPLSICDAMSLFASGDFSAATELFEQALDHARAVRDARYVSYALSKLGLTATVGGDFEQAELRFREAAAAAEVAGDLWMRAEAAVQHANLVVSQGRFGEAADLFAETAAAWRELGDAEGVAHSVSNVAFAHLQQGRIADAVGPAAESAAFYVSIRFPTGTLYSLVLLAGILVELGRPAQAILMLEAASDLEADTGIVLEPTERALRERIATDAVAAIGEEWVSAAKGRSPYEVAGAGVAELLAYQRDSPAAHA